MNNIVTRHVFPVNDFKLIKKKVLNWSKQFSTFCFLDNHQYQIEPHTVECLLAAGCRQSISYRPDKTLDQLQAFIDQGPRWLFGHLNYDLKNEIEQLSSVHPDHIDFPDFYFFEPEILIRLTAHEMIIESADADNIHAQIDQLEIHDHPIGNADKIKVQSRFTKGAYIKVIEHLRQHILRGDCYEINFCQEFFAEHASIDPLMLYEQLSDISPNPFSALYCIHDKWLLCASPERFIKKEGRHILSQPIKGTSKRFTENKTADIQSSEELKSSTKDQSENVMIVDLVRNDLSRVCIEGTVKVDELFGIYSFPQVHQMISTVSGTLKKDISFTDILRASFPMGSMTGAPKKRVMELIERYETTRRGIFSGAVGYLDPEGDFDFNVVIRSIMYDAVSKYLSFQVGSGITFYSEPEKEWEECMMKASAMLKLF